MIYLTIYLLRILCKFCKIKDTQWAIEEAMGRERKPGGHVLTRWHDRQPSPHPGGTPLDIGTPAGADGGGGRGKDAEPRIDPAISNLRPGQTLKVAVNLGRASNHVCTVQSRQVSDQMDNTFAASLPTTSCTSSFLPSCLLRAPAT